MKLSNKLLIALSLGLLALTSCKKEKDGYTINGVIKFENDIDSVYIYQYGVEDLGKALNSAPVINNKFTLTGKVDAVQKVIFGNVNKNFGADLILENDEFNIEATQTNLLISGGKTHQKVLGFISSPEYIKMVANYNNKTDELFKNVNMEDEEALNTARKKADELGNEVMEHENKVFDAIIDSEKEETITKLMALITTQNWKKYPKEKTFELLNEYEKELGDHVNIKIHREFLKAEENVVAMKETVKKGSPYKEIVANDINGKSIALSELVKNNKFTLLEFWASWCGPCRAEIPNLKKAYEKYKDLGLEIYSVSSDIKRKDWELALKEEQTAWPNSLFVGDEGKKQMDSYGVQGIPASFLIAQDGTIVASNEELREFNLDRTLSEFLTPN